MECVFLFQITKQEIVEVSGERKRIHFIKLSAPWEVLIDYAEALCFRAPLQEHVQPPKVCNVYSCIDIAYTFLF